jgi:hypothetical protein
MDAFTRLKAKLQTLATNRWRKLSIKDREGCIRLTYVGAPEKSIKRMARARTPADYHELRVMIRLYTELVIKSNPKKRAAELKRLKDRFPFADTVKESNWLREKIRFYESED